ncbi:n-acetylgalactosamine-4-sulfatase [Echinicola strongylocentroti]|uniref:N-acetylgalactosamine-4-sulfatase n=1 Tax=Echinicola strongylocentroti TaxID=1795355 RepID=A0A2Z4IES7_9BACT|nr:arylsulfatase [Echinicola strongylocentroti]AWW29591.1 n-acetylgalactosamine-4-sulfatase [Echinicola strongylocentroti]
MNAIIRYSIILFSLVTYPALGQEDERPNVILILTDDQGIGDLGCHGNPWLKTPNIDRFYSEAVRLTDFHVSPLCTPTRSSIMTGQYPIHNGTWATYKGRDMLPPNTSTMADIFQANGYQTSMFGKWHLGDNYPSRPTDMGFQFAVHHKAGGVGELSDYWGNSYFDDTYYVNNEPEKFEGYCTDVWFGQTMDYIRSHQEDPFFVYLATNAPHSPHIVADEYADPYRDLEEKGEIVNANFYGMIANIDENMGKLEAFLKEEGLYENTIVIYMSDNGSAAGISPDGKTGYNMGFRGKKGHPTEGGHRVPFFIRWPDRGIMGGTDVNSPSQHVDLIPTLAGLCDLEIPNDKPLDGRDISPLLTGREDEIDDETLFIHHNQDWRVPRPVTGTCIINGKWRLVDGRSLYDVSQDRYQAQDLSGDFPEVKARLLAENAAFYEQASQKSAFREIPVNIIGHSDQQEVTLTIQHAIGESSGIWKSEQVAQGMKNTNNKHAIQVASEGRYRISCYRWPKECPGTIWGTPDQNPKGQFSYLPIKPEKVKISIANQMMEKEIDASMIAVDFDVYLEKGKTFLVNEFVEGAASYGVYYTYISKLE